MTRRLLATSENRADDPAEQPGFPRYLLGRFRRRHRSRGGLGRCGFLGELSREPTPHQNLCFFRGECSVCRGRGCGRPGSGVDSLPFGTLVTDREGRIVYANGQYGQFAGGMADGVPVGVPRLFAGQPEASEAIYRLSRASREGRPATEDIRLTGGLGGGFGGSTTPFWYRVSVRALPEIDADARPLVIWSVEDITRDRERGVPRYNEFRRQLHLAPAKTFSDITDNPVWAKELEDMYGDVERVDLQIGMHAETPPRGFGFSDTAFRVFILMASRRIKSDRFLTDCFTEEYYTKTGLKWVADNTMVTVLERHYPELGKALDGVDNAFAPWKAVA